MKKIWLIPLIVLTVLVTAHVGLYLTDVVSVAHAADNGWGDEYGDDSDDDDDDSDNDDSNDDDDNDEYYDDFEDDEDDDSYDEAYFSGDDDSLFLIQFLILMGLVSGIDTDDTYMYHDEYDDRYGYDDRSYNGTAYRPYDPLNQAPHDTGILRIKW